MELLHLLKLLLEAVLVQLNVESLLSSPLAEEVHSPASVALPSPEEEAALASVLVDLSPPAEAAVLASAS